MMRHRFPRVGLPGVTTARRHAQRGARRRHAARVTVRDGRVEKDEIRESAGYRESATTTERAGTGKVDVG
jgi:hypothetical protein